MSMTRDEPIHRYRVSVSASVNIFHISIGLMKIEPDTDIIKFTYYFFVCVTGFTSSQRKYKQVINLPHSYKCYELTYAQYSWIYEIKLLMECYLIPQNVNNLIFIKRQNCQNLKILRGSTSFQEVIFYLWSDLDEICTVYVKLNSNSLFMQIFWISVWFEKYCNFWFFFVCFS